MKALKHILIVMAAAIALTMPAAAQQQKKMMFDLSHGQLIDSNVNSTFYDYVIPDYKTILEKLNMEYVENHAELTADQLKDIDVVLILSPLTTAHQRPFTEAEKRDIAEYVRNGGSVILMVEEEHRVNLSTFGVNDITSQFGIVLGGDIEDVPGNCGAVSLKGEVFSGEWGIPYSGSRTVTGGTPASMCMEGGYVHGAYVKTAKGGKLFVTGEQMGGLLMGNPDGDRNVHKNMASNWWGKDSRMFMQELIKWAAE